MGTLIYGDSGLIVDFDDRVLAHLQIVIGAKLRRHEGFFFTWKDDLAGREGEKYHLAAELDSPAFPLFDQRP